MEKKTKNKNIKDVEPQLIKTTNDDTDQVKKFAYILVGVAVIALLLYVFTTKVLVKDSSKKDDNSNSTAVSINYSILDVGMMFNRPYDEYYILAYDPDSLDASLYASMLNKVDSKKGKVYFLDLSNGLNKPYVKDESNAKATKASEVAIKGPTMIKISKGKISKYLESYEEIEDEYTKELK